MDFNGNDPITKKQVIKAWWPLASSWLLMAFEMPIVVSFLTRLANPTENIAALGGITFAIALMIESPIMMLLTASTALSTNYTRYRSLRKYMLAMAGTLTLLHVTIATTGLFDVVVVKWLDTPSSLHELVRISLLIMSPWSFSIAYRRFYQGILIRAGKSKMVGEATFVRFVTEVIFLCVGKYLHISGAVLGACAVVLGVVVEAVFVGIKVFPVVEDLKRASQKSEDGLGVTEFFGFYTPLAVSTILGLLIQPLGSGGISRMPLPIQSLASWPIVTTTFFIFRSAGLSVTELYIAHQHRVGSFEVLKRFAYLFGFISVGLLVISVATPLIEILFSSALGLSYDLQTLSTQGLLLGLPLAFTCAPASLYHGILTSAKKTYIITIGVISALTVTAIIVLFGVYFGKFPGILIASFAFGIGSIVQLLFLRIASARFVYANQDLCISETNIIEEELKSSL